MHHCYSRYHATYIKVRRLEWADHIVRMEEERIPKIHIAINLLESYHKYIAV